MVPPRSSRPRSPTASSSSSDQPSSDWRIHVQSLTSDAEAEGPTTQIFDQPLVSSPQEPESLPASISRRHRPSPANSRPASLLRKPDVASIDASNSDIGLSVGIQSPTIEELDTPLSPKRSFLILRGRPASKHLDVKAVPDVIPRSRSPSVHLPHRLRRNFQVMSDPPEDSSSDELSYHSAYKPKPRKTAKPWRKFVHKLKEYDDKLVKGWKEDIDTLLVYAGLFSAVLTAFIVESYKLLQQDSGQASATLLQLIANRLLDNSLPEITTTSTAPFQQSAFAVRINALWFSSLVFSLAAASVGILAKQWLRDYISSSAGSPREAARIRQFRHAGLVKWHIPEIIALLPVLLQFSLAFFFIGLLDLLWTLDFVVAGIITVFVSISLSFLVITTLLPTLSRSSPHRSPQALAVYRMVHVLKHYAVYILMKVAKYLRLDNRPWPVYFDPSVFAGHRRRRFRAWLQQQRHGRILHNWRELEKYYVRKQEPDLDHQFIAGADALFMDDKMLARIIRPCISETDSTTAVKCLIDILIQRAHGNNDGEPTWSHHSTVDRGMATLLHLSVDVLERMNPSVDESATARMLTVFEKLYKATPLDFEQPDIVHLHRKIHLTLPLLLGSSDGVARKAFKIISDSQTQNPLTAELPDDVKVIDLVVEYAQKQRLKNESSTFYEACCVALRLATSTLRQLPSLGFDSRAVSVKRQIDTLMSDLETYIGHNPHPMPSPSLMMALLGYVKRNPGVIESTRGLVDALRPTIGMHADTIPARGHSGATDITRAQEQLRRLFSPRVPRPVRRNAGLPAIELNEMNLHLPTTPSLQTGGSQIVSPSPVAGGSGQAAAP